MDAVDKQNLVISGALLAAAAFVLYRNPRKLCVWMRNVETDEACTTACYDPDSPSERKAAHELAEMLHDGDTYEVFVARGTDRDSCMRRR